MIRFPLKATTFYSDITRAEPDGAISPALHYCYSGLFSRSPPPPSGGGGGELETPPARGGRSRSPGGKRRSLQPGECRVHEEEESGSELSDEGYRSPGLGKTAAGTTETGAYQCDLTCMTHLF